MKAHSAAIGKNPPTLEAPLQKKKKEAERHKDDDSMALMFVMDL